VGAAEQNSSLGPWGACLRGVLSDWMLVGIPLGLRDWIGKQRMEEMVDKPGFWPMVAAMHPPKWSSMAVERPHSPGSDAHLAPAALASLAASAATAPRPAFIRRYWDRVVAGSDLVTLATEKLRKDIAVCVEAVVEGLLMKTRDATLSLLLWLEINGFEADPSQAPITWVSRFMEKTFWDFAANQYEERMKYLTADMMARHLDEFGERPPCPAWMKDPTGRCVDSTFLGGAAFVWWEAAMKRGGREQLRLCGSLVNLKKRQPEIPEEKMDAAIVEWVEKLFTARPVPELPLLADVRRVVRKLAEGPLRKGLTAEYIPLALPSTRARLERAGKKGGGFAELQQTILKRVMMEEEGVSWIRVPVEKFVRMDVDGFTEVTVEGFVPHVLPKLFLEVISDVLEVLPHALAEPFKVRMISKGPALPYWVVGYIQKATHGALQALPEFRLTRERPDRGIDISSLLTEVVGAKCPSDEYFVSGDYKGSTDNLDPRLSALIGEELGRVMGLTGPVLDLYVRSLVGHVHAGQPQRWGQLMGSPTSFPVLCMANLALTLVALRRVEGAKARPVGGSGILINGDDIGFRASRAAIESWKELTSAYGLQPSVGKNFCSRRFIQLNSRMFVPDLDRHRLPVFREVVAPSLAVLYPPRRVDFNEWCLSAPSWQRTFVGTGPEADRLNTMWIDVWRHYLEKLPGHLPWFVPRELLGFGLTPTRPLQVTTAQQHAAAYARDFTTPESYRACKLVFEQPEATTNVYDEVEAYGRLMAKLGMVEWRWGREGEEPLVFSEATTLLATGGYCGPWVDQTDTKGKSTGEQLVYRLEPPWVAPVAVEPTALARVGAMAGPGEREEQDALNPTLFTFQRSPFVAPAISVELRSRPPSNGWLAETLRRIRRAQRSTSRVMSVEDISRWRGRKAGYFLLPGVMRTGGGLKVHRSGRMVSLPSESPPFPVPPGRQVTDEVSVTTFGPFVALTTHTSIEVPPCPPQGFPHTQPGLGPPRLLITSGQV